MMERQQFLSLPIDAVREVAPATVIYCPGGTRRAAALAGLRVPSEEFVRWSLRELWESVTRLFDHGVRHVFTGMLFPTTWQETTPEYRQQIARWTAWAMAGDEALAEYRRKGWCVRAPGVALFPSGLGLAEAAARLERETAHPADHTLWLQSYPTADAALELVLEAAAQHGARTRAEAVRAVYGMDVPPATMLISSGKLMTASFIVPPLLHGEISAYWKQRPGNDLTEAEIRAIFYDAAYLRATWQADKTSRELAALADAEQWHTAPIVGIGRRLGPYWIAGGERDGD